jgi:hypothetical protein
MASTCFEHYLLILRQPCTISTWYIMCVLCQLAALGLNITHIQYIKCHCLAPPEDEQVMLETCKKR